MTLAAALVIASTLAWMALEGRAAHDEPDARLPRELATGLALLAIHVAGLVEHLAGGARAAGAVLAIGGVALAGGIALRLWAIRTLGDDFVSATVAPARVVRAGAYRFLWHPSELGLVAAAAGASLVLGSAIAAALTALVLVPLSVARCRAEERVLAR